MEQDIPEDQLKRIRPVVEPLLEELRRQTRQLTSQSEPAVDYQVEQ